MNRSTKSVSGYRTSQIFAHWLVVALVVVQLLSHDAMEDYWDYVEDGEAGWLPTEPIAFLHAASGATILVLMLVRVALRLRYGAPPPPADLGPLVRLGAHASHFALYALLLALPLSGASALLFAWDDAADLHSSLTLALWVLVALHIGAALYHAVIRRDGVFKRIFIPG